MPGGADLPPPTNNGGNGREVPKLSWNLISYRDWCQTKGFTTFRYLEPSKLMVWKTDFFWWFLRFVRVPPYESWANWTNFLSSCENGKFFLGQTCCTLFHTQNEEKSQKISTCIRIHTRVYANTWWWGQICPPPSRIGLNLDRIMLAFEMPACLSPSTHKSRGIQRCISHYEKALKLQNQSRIFVIWDPVVE